MRRAYLLYLLAALLLAVSAVLPEPSPEHRLERVATDLQARIQLRQQQLEAQARSCLDAWRTAPCDQPAGLAFLSKEAREQWELEGTELLLLCSDSLVAWTGLSPITAVRSKNSTTLVNDRGCWLRASATDADGRRVTAAALLWYQPPFENRYLNAHFDAAFHVPKGVVAAPGPGLGPALRAPEGRVLFRLQWANDAPPPGPLTWLRTALLASGCILLLLALHRRAAELRSVQRARVAFLLPAAVLVLLRAGWMLLDPWPWLSTLSLFDPDLFASSAFLPSLGDLLINAGLLFFLAAQARRSLIVAAPPRHPEPWAVLFLSAMLGAAAWVNAVMVALVRDSRLALDLFHVQDVDLFSGAALLALGLVQFAWLLLMDGGLRWLMPALRARAATIIALVLFGAAHLVHHLFGAYDSLLVLWPLPMLLVLAAMRHSRPRLWHGAALVALCALVAVHILNGQVRKRHERDRAALVEAASTREDPVIELLFGESRSAMAAEPSVVRLLRDTLPLSAAELDARIRQPFFSGVWNNYDVRLHLFSGSGNLRGSTSREDMPTLTALRLRFEQGIPVPGDGALRNVHRPLDPALYIGVLGDGAGGRLVVEVLPRILPEGLGFPELLMAGERAMERRTDLLARARYERGALVESTRAYAFPVRWTLPVPPEGLTLTRDGYELVASGDPAGTTVVVATPLPHWTDHVTTFSYTFLFLALLGTLLFLPLVRHALLPTPLGLGAKLRIGVLALAAIAMALFAFGARRLIQRDLSAATDQAMDERSRSAVAELRRMLRLETELTPAMLRDVEHLVDDASTVLRTDLTLFGSEGQLLATSREQVFANGLLAPRMHPAAYTALVHDLRSFFVQEERIGEARFRTAYRPLVSDRGAVLGYLAVPYFARQDEVEEQRAAGYVAVVNLLVVLLLLSIVAAALIATWTTRPLVLLRRGLERIQLGARNEPILYNGQDELGELVRVYNRKVEELRASAEKLARSERESAWREMARQVAHEIKNPLTPMKLRIQLFQRSWDPAAPDAKEKLDKLSTGLVEQIDALSGVASAFSQFAQMPEARPEPLDLRAVARAAVDVFHATPGIDIVLHDGPELPVHADREHLLRVFNNLLKNAVQAIPEDRDGRIEVRLRHEGDRAIAEVQDNGSGIPGHLRDRIFTPSFTTKGSGMGLGLAMVKRMVEQAGGTVRFDSREDEGTTFVVALPLRT